jgi:xylulose-5-phosphate/fructose-6-phosphate phosphoketolase
VDRFNLAIDVIEGVLRLKASGAHVKDWLRDQIVENLAYAHEFGIDKPEIRDWRWPYS